jgi:hypothetical protein
MKKFLLFSLIASTILVAACKRDILPPYTPPVTSNFSVTSLKHTKDTVSVGDTIYLTAAGTAYSDTGTGQKIAAYLTSTYTAGGVSSVQSFYTATAPDTLKNAVFTAGTAPLLNWTATIQLVGATAVPHKTKLTIAGNFLYTLSLSSEQGTLTATDAGIKNKTIFVQ